MNKIKRLSAFLISISAIVLVMKAVLNSAEKSIAAFSPTPGELTVLDKERLLPISSCTITIINEDISCKTDSNGKVRIDLSDASFIAYKEGYAPYLLMHHDFSEDCKIFLEKDTKAAFSAKLDDDYAQKLIESFLK